jgi:uncharacterized membrane protein
MNRFFGALLRYFFKGVLIVLPLGAAVYLTWWVISSLDRWLNVSDKFAPLRQSGEMVYIPGLGILTVLVVILIAGIVVTNFITDPIKAWFGRWLKRLPLFNFLYSSIKDLTEAFVGDEKKFNEPVLVEVNETGLKKVGFLTQKDLSALDLPGEVAVYFPWSYSFAGQLCIVSKEYVKPLKMSGTDAMKFVVSGGVSGM